MLPARDGTLDRGRKPLDEPLYPLLAVSRHRMGTDGTGVTTLVAGAGCPLSCRWCLNRDLLATGKPRPITARELYDRVAIDDLYFLATGGGVTFGGGESLLHAGFISAFRAVCGSAWRITAETSLAVPWRQAAEASEVVDEFIVDCKDMDDGRYRRYTGGDGAVMRENLRKLADTVGPERLVVRVPLIPEYNTEADQARSAELLREMGITRLDLFSYTRVT